MANGVPDALMMDPFTDTMGVLVIIPLYLNPATTVGGPTLPISVSTPPTWTLNGDPITLDLVTIDAQLRAMVYQIPSFGSILSTDVLTMSAPKGWATTAGGDLGGTSGGGTGSDPLTVVNNVGLTIEAQYDTAIRAMRMAINVPPYNAIGQPKRNWCSRLNQALWSGTVNTFDPTTKLPATIGVAGCSCYLFATGANGIDASGYPMTEGRWRLTYGDATPGVDADTHKLHIDLVGNTGWTEHVISAGTWSGSEWNDIITEYTWANSAGVTSYVRLDLFSTAVGGQVIFPDKGNGQVELCVTSPSVADSDVAQATSYDPFAIDEQYLAVHTTFRPKAVRWMPAGDTMDGTGNRYGVYVEDLDLRQIDDFQWTIQEPFPSATINIIKIEPLPGSIDAIIPYLGTSPSQPITLANWGDFSARVPMLCTTDVDHNLRTDNILSLTGTTSAPNPVVDTGLTLDADIVTTSGTTTITVSNTAGLSGFIQIDSEQLGILSTLGPTSLSVSRGINGTTGATHTNGATVFPGLSVGNSDALIVTGARTFVISQISFAVNTNQTIAGTVNYTPPDSPSFPFTVPPNTNSTPYEFQAKAANDIALANGMETILWINFALLASAAYVTEVVQNHIAPYLTSPLVTLICELGNELWNVGFHSTAACFELFRTAPNPETAGTGFTDARAYITSRQNQITQAAKSGMVAASLDPDRVYNFQPGHAQDNFGQGDTSGSIGYAQLHNIPIDYMSMGSYTGFTPEPWTLFWNWMPVADGGGASWSRAFARRVAMSYMRAWWWFSPFVGVSIAGAAQLMSWYKAGKSVPNSGVGDANANTGLGKLCIYEGGTELDAVTIGDFVFPVAMEHDWIQDGLVQYPGDTGWHATETAFLAAVQGAAAMYAALMPPASFPDLTSATMGFLSYFASVFVAPSPGGGQPNGSACYDVYDWQGQPHGMGASNTMGWDPTTPVFQTWQNVSVRGQAIIDWNAPTPTFKPWIYGDQIESNGAG